MSCASTKNVSMPWLAAPSGCNARDTSHDANDHR